MGHRLTSRNGTVQPFAVAPQIVKGGRPLGALLDDLQDYSAHAIGSVALCQTREAGRTLA